MSLSSEEYAGLVSRIAKLESQVSDIASLGQAIEALRAKVNGIKITGSQVQGNIDSGWIVKTPEFQGTVTCANGVATITLTSV